MKRQGPEAVHLSPSSAYVIVWTYTSTSRYIILRVETTLFLILFCAFLNFTSRGIMSLHLEAFPLLRWLVPGLITEAQVGSQTSSGGIYGGQSSSGKSLSPSSSLFRASSIPPVLTNAVKF